MTKDELLAQLADGPVTIELREKQNGSIVKWAICEQFEVRDNRIIIYKHHIKNGLQ